MVRGGVPAWYQLCTTTSPALRVDRPVSQKGNLVSRHIGLSREKLRKSVRQEARGKGIKKAACPFAGIIQIKFERYDLRTSSSPTLPVCDESVNVSRQMGWIGDKLEHPPCMLQIEKIPVDIMTTCLTVITPEGEEVGWNPGMLPSRHRTDG